MENEKIKYAFPTLGDYGMTLRDYFAAAALQGLMPEYHLSDAQYGKESVAQAAAEHAYVMADAMLKARGQQ